MSTYRIDLCSMPIGWQAHISYTPSGESPRDDDPGALPIDGPKLWRPTESWTMRAALGKAARHDRRVSG